MPLFQVLRQTFVSNSSFKSLSQKTTWAWRVFYRQGHDAPADLFWSCFSSLWSRNLFKEMTDVFNLQWKEHLSQSQRSHPCRLQRLTLQAEERRLTFTEIALQSIETPFTTHRYHSSYCVTPKYNWPLFTGDILGVINHNYKGCIIFGEPSRDVLLFMLCHYRDLNVSEPLLMRFVLFLRCLFWKIYLLIWITLKKNLFSCDSEFVVVIQ